MPWNDFSVTWNDFPVPWNEISTGENQILVLDCHFSVKRNEIRVPWNDFSVPGNEISAIGNHFLMPGNQILEPCYEIPLVERQISTRERSLTLSASDAKPPDTPAPSGYSPGGERSKAAPNAPDGERSPEANHPPKPPVRWRAKRSPHTRPDPSGRLRLRAHKSLRWRVLGRRRSSFWRSRGSARSAVVLCVRRAPHTTETKPKWRDPSPDYRRSTVAIMR